jgi:cbb3-type cytochrome oxidase maturation protein
MRKIIGCGLKIESFCAYNMSVIIILMVFSILVAASFLGAYLWSVKTGQFEDPDASAFRILIDDRINQKTEKQTK